MRVIPNWIYRNQDIKLIDHKISMFREYMISHHERKNMHKNGDYLHTFKPYKVMQRQQNLNEPGIINIHQRQVNECTIIQACHKFYNTMVYTTYQANYRKYIMSTTMIVNILYNMSTDIQIQSSQKNSHTQYMIFRHELKSMPTNED